MLVSISMSTPIVFSNSTACGFCGLFRSFFSAVLEELATGVPRRLWIDFGGAHLGFFCRPGVRSFFGGEGVEFVLSRNSFDVYLDYFLGTREENGVCER